MTPGDYSQLPVEQLAQLLLLRAREDVALAQRLPANDDRHAGHDDMQSRIEALPAMQREDDLALSLPPRLGEPAAMEALEELVAVALTSAQDAEALSQQASRRARRGTTLAVALGILGMVIAAGGACGTWLLGGQDGQMGQIAGQMQALDALQHKISDQLTQLEAQNTVHVTNRSSTAAASAQPPSRAAVPTALPPLTTQHVGVLPAHAALPAEARDSTGQAVNRVSPVAYTPGGWSSRPPQEAVMLGQAEMPRQRRRVAPPQIVMPWPAVYVIATVHRGMVSLFR